MTVSTDLEKRVHARIDELEDELVKVAIDLGDMDASLPPGQGEPGKRSGIGDIKYHEKRAAEYVEAWFRGNGFGTKRQGAPDRYNVLATYKGTGGGRSVLFNSHMDVGIRENTQWKIRDPHAAHRVGAWRDGDQLVGAGVVNCKGPMTCWMICAKAIKDLGIELPGDLLLSAVIGETGGAPIDEFEAPKWDSHDLGARYVASHGGLADYAIVGEVTGFTIVPTMTGNAYFKVTIYGGPSTYTPYMRRPERSPESSVNAIVRMASFIYRFEEYATQYERESAREFEGGIMTPHATIGGIRGGTPTQPSGSAELCSLYIDFRTDPSKSHLDLKRDLEGILRDMGAEGDVEMFKSLKGQDAWNNQGFDTLKKSVVDAHTRMFDEPPKNVASQFVSMWRDVNPYNEIGVPALCYGFATNYTQEGASTHDHTSGAKIADMLTATKVYASVALDLCSRPASDPR
jgi:acetylornithine deacetylase/succinyl-diaminopimelate desuccinylase-like protein